MRGLWLILGILIPVAALVIAYATLGTTRGGPNSIIAPQGAVTPSQQPTLEITYIANEGVLITSGDKQVLIDGLHREYKRAYAFLPEAEREKIEHAEAPFHQIDLILVSHLHRDHFHPEAVGLHLKHNSEAMLVSSEQVVKEVEQHFEDYQAIRARVIGTTPPLKQKLAMKVAGINFDILGLGHGSGRHEWIQNLGHIIELGGKKLLHLGDAAPTAEIFEPFNLDEEGIDVAFLPVWFLLSKEGKEIVRAHIKPKHIIAVHISPAEAEKAAAQIKQVFPDAVALTTLLEKRHY